eukprot:CAMPEP_0115035208 /NCGR_PEP_ID=MMETSP0216-20121206/41269_1 /TAXON_ID=223996 /ORGANISM="Protocruzia adherens, Strain Boccale" /LENGTH=320 /DNA_ID=CAMNT_0002414559 /DNA_START=50 /DNA_END=1012 /DNA_ORIENTATION=-
MAPIPQNVVVHPLVLLSVVDHFTRVARDTKRRVVGVLLGEHSRGTLDVTNSYAIPFEEDPREPGIWFLDHNYHEEMFAMFRKINAKEKIVGWYSSGPKIKSNDIEINEIFKKYTPNPTLVVVDVQETDPLGLPVESYSSVEEAGEDGSIKKTFVHIPSTVGASEAEEVGVEHLLRDIKDVSIGSLSVRVNDKMESLKGLVKKIKTIKDYLDDIVEGRKTTNQEVLYSLQDILNLLPNLNIDELIKAFTVKTNDSMLVMYLCSMLRSITAIHSLINNKLQNKELEKKSRDEKREKKEKAAQAAAESKAEEKEKKSEPSANK